MNRRFDVIIVGAGPAGLECAKVLKDSAYSVLVLERKRAIGLKPCAGGIVESVEPLDLPDHQATILHRHQIHIRNNIHRFTSKMPIKIIDRLALGKYQAQQLENAPNITIRSGVPVRKVEKGKVHTSDGDYGYQFLVGADGAGSVVRRYLQLASGYTIGMYYDVPDITEQLIVYLDGRSLGTGYIWEFPHQGFTNVGIHYNPERFATARARDALHAYMNKKQYRVDAATYRASPIMYLYKGCEFMNRIFLAGDAAGLACKLTGEGISYALISGREVARKILNSEYRMTSLDRLVKRKKKQEKLVCAFEKVPAGLDWFYNLFLKSIKHIFIAL